MRKGIVMTTLFIIIAVAGILGAYVSALKTVTLYDGSHVLTIKTSEKTVADVLEEKHIKLDPSDLVEPDLGRYVNNGTEIFIQRGFDVTIKTGETERVIKTNISKVKDILIQANIVYDNDDKITPGLDDIIKGPAEIVVTKVEKKVLTEEVPIPFKVEYKPDASLAAGERHLISEGKPGIRLMTTTVVYEDGIEVSKEVTEETVKPSKNKIIALGKNLTASRDSRPENYKQEFNMVATAYTHTGNLTATDTEPRYGVVAVDPKLIPLNSRLYIEGYGYARAEDTGGSIKGNRIDLFFETKKEAMRFGRRNVKVYIVE